MLCVFSLFAKRPWHFQLFCGFNGLFFSSLSDQKDITVRCIPLTFDRKNMEGYQFCLCSWAVVDSGWSPPKVNGAYRKHLKTFRVHMGPLSPEKGQKDPQTHQFKLLPKSSRRRRQRLKLLFCFLVFDIQAAFCLFHACLLNYTDVQVYSICIV